MAVMRLKNKVAMITGGSRGIGKAIEMKFVDEGRRVSIKSSLFKNYQ